MKNIKYLNAGAGSGKTYFLTQTFAEHVIEHGKDPSKGCSPSEVIMTTFSEKAAADIKRNARTRFLANGLADAATELDAANIGTVHAIAYKYIKKYWYLLGISAQCDVMTDDSKASYMALTLGKAAGADDIAAFRRYADHFDMKLMMSSKYDYDFWRGAVAGIISKADSMGIADLSESRRKSLELLDTCFGEARAGDPDYDITREVTERIFRIAADWRDDFERYKKDNSIIEYNDMESLFLRLLKEPEFKEVQDEISDSIRYVFVDEFQDSNPKQLEIFDRLSDLVQKSYWVGDPKQAIYGFRACDTELVSALTQNIREKVGKGVKGFETDTLNISRRSLEPIVTFTNDMFVPIFHPMASADVELKPLYRTEPPLCGVPCVQHWDGAMRENARGTLMPPGKELQTDQLASEIRRILDGKGQFREVYDKDDKKLAREIRPSDIAVLCRTNGDIAAVAAGLRKYQVPVVIKSTADASKVEIRLVLLLLNYVLGSDAPLLKAEIAKLWGGLSLRDILEKSLTDVEAVIADLDEYRKTLSGKGVASIVRGLVLRMDLLDTCARWGDAESRRDNLMALMQNARDYEAGCLTIGASATVEGFISQIEAGEISVEGYATGGVNIVTYHGSKGLQWPVVIMYSLTNDMLSDVHTAKSFLWDVQAVRKARPTAANLYPGYYITYTPKRTNGHKESVPQEFMDNICAMTGTGCYADYRESCTLESRRLLYVGVTRARDILVEMGPKSKKLDMLLGALGDLNPGCGWTAKTDKKWEDGTMQEIWGPGTPEFYYRVIEADDPPAAKVETEFTCLPKVAPDTEEEAKRVSPSSLEDEALVNATATVCLNDDGSPFPQTISKASGAKDDEVGTCIHHIFAVYDPAIPRTDMVAFAGDIIRRHGLESVLTDPGAVITSIETLYRFLEDTYGKCTRTEHELPFRRLEKGQMMVGSIDLVWFTSDRDCVLVDFKNLPGASRDVLSPEDTRFPGHYAPQQNAYREALKRAGLDVKACLIYLSMQSRVIELK